MTKRAFQLGVFAIVLAPMAYGEADLLLLYSNISPLKVFFLILAEYVAISATVGWFASKHSARIFAFGVVLIWMMYAAMASSRKLEAGAMIVAGGVSGWTVCGVCAFSHRLRRRKNGRHQAEMIRRFDDPVGERW